MDQLNVPLYPTHSIFKPNKFPYPYELLPRKKQWEGPVALLTYTTDSKICTATGNNGNAAPTLRFAC